MPVIGLALEPLQFPIAAFSARFVDFVAAFCAVSPRLVLTELISIAHSACKSAVAVVPVA